MVSMLVYVISMQIINIAIIVIVDPFDTIDFCKIIPEVALKVFMRVPKTLIMNKNNIDAQTQLELEAAAFRRLRDHLRKRTDVQNIDLMNLSGFCRNCLSRWYMEEANEKGIGLDKKSAREIVYGMPFTEWRDKYQTEASGEQKTKFEETVRLSDHN